MKQQELPFPKIPRGQIDQQEYARVLDKEGNFKEYVNGTYDEVEDYCQNKGYWVDRYLDHVDPMVVQAHFQYVGSGHNSTDVARPIYQRDKDGKFIGYTEFKEKW